MFFVKVHLGQIVQEISPSCCLLYTGLTGVNVILWQQVWNPGKALWKH